jgi:hypothetical protein
MSGEDDFEARVAAAAAEAQERIARCHEVVACPRCRSGAGEPCVSMSKSVHDRELKHPHVERWTLVQPMR